MPLCPYFLNENGLGMMGPGKPWRTFKSLASLLSSGWPAYVTKACFGSKVSTWLGAPLMNSEITALARGLKWGCSQPLLDTLAGKRYRTYNHISP